MPPQITILIPTRDRPDTLRYCLETIIAQCEPDIEILVSDNFSAEEVKKVVESFSDKRIRYIRTPERFGMVEHWNFALNYAKGDWVSIVGDDDALLPGAITRLSAIIKQNPEIRAISGANCFYTWPSATGDKAKFRLIIGKGYEIRNSMENLKKTMLGKIAYLPTIYTGGFVHKDVIEKVKSKSPDNRFFNSIIPDVYSGMAIASVTDKYIYSWEAFGIAGVSKYSNGQQHKNKTREQMKKLDFYNESNMKFLPTLGDACVESMQILLYESFLQSSHLRNDDFGVNLSQQLEISVLHSSRRTRASVIEYCRDVARINNIDFEPILKTAEQKIFQHKIKRLARRLAKKIPGFSKLNRKNIKAEALDNIHKAAKTAGKLLTA